MLRRKKAPPRRVLTGPARFVLRLGLISSCLMLAGALVLALNAGPLTAHNVHTHRLIADLYRTPQAVLLTSALGALIIEERLS